jgi:drug/metabolite transporter (DMT)-like permease
MGIGTATILFYAAYMVASYVIGRIFFAEKITIAKIAAMICAVIGMIMVFGIELAGVSALALSMAILNGVASGGEVSFTKKVSDRYSVLQLTFVTWVVIFIVHFIFAVFQNETLLPVQTPMSIIGILLFATTAMLAYWLVVAGYKTIEAGIGGLIGTLEVPFAVILGALFFAEQLAPIAIVGGALIFIAAAIPDGVDIIRRRQLRQTAIK